MNKARFSGYLDQFAEHVIHKQILKSPLITSNPDEADLFYVPVYGAAVVSQEAHNPEKRDAARQRILDAQKGLPTATAMTAWTKRARTMATI